MSIFLPEMNDTQKQNEEQIESEERNVYPSWHRKSQKAYFVNKIIIILQIIAAFVMAGVIWFGVDRVLR
ncbi:MULTISPECIES: hypothetical protein [unclassified Fibrobacter]|uniref:hypothetical protein n=1 Tax=unclassified Fibrobacter TaxID=2634177 RepID=UPI0009190126|nr:MULTISPECIES: hypothetical protein [unclassified Fibrobacter]OWV17030.1 hypothetical protein B7992_01910 [Fibrobacter sp. UWH1]SHL25585.1 hypothetical protein SAMN05720764_11078 [Fibrobacter sp. UWH5]